MLRRWATLFLIMIALGLLARPARSQPAPPPPVTPAVVGFAPRGTIEPGNVTVMGGYAYIYGGRYYPSPRMDVFSIADPALPQLTATYTAPSAITRIAATPTHLYLATAEHGLRVLSLADPVHPVEVGAFTSVATVLDVTLGPGYLLIAAKNDGLRVLSLADPAHPAEIGALNWMNYLTYGWAADGVKVSGTVAYVSGYSIRSAIFRKIRIIDLRDPTRPSDITTESPFHVNTSYLLDVRDGYAYLGQASGPWVSVVDLRDPAAITGTGWVEVQPTNPSVGELFGSYLYVGGYGGVSVVDVSDPAAPTHVGHALEDVGVNDLTLRGPYLYVASQYGLHILNHGLTLGHQLYLPALHGPDLPAN